MKTETNTATEAAADYEKSRAELRKDLEQAIARSISHDEGVDVPVDGSALDLLDAVLEITEITDDYDYVKEDATLYDVWGELDGQSFRLHVYKA